MVPAPASAGPAYGLNIIDSVGLPGEAQPDSVTVFRGWNSYPGSAPLRLVFPQIERQGELIEGNPSGWQTLRTADLQDGDTIVLRDVYSYFSVVARYAYQRTPVLESPACAGATRYEGALPIGATGVVGGEAVLWQGDPSKQATPAPNDPGFSSVPSDASYRAGTPATALRSGPCSRRQVRRLGALPSSRNARSPPACTST